MSSCVLLSGYCRLLYEKQDQHRATRGGHCGFHEHANLIWLLARGKSRAFGAAVRVECRKPVLIVVTESGSEATQASNSCFRCSTGWQHRPDEQSSGARSCGLLHGVFSRCCHSVRSGPPSSKMSGQGGPGRERKTDPACHPTLSCTVQRTNCGSVEQEHPAISAGERV
jgi:hypothetical protein